MCLPGRILTNSMSRYLHASILRSFAKRRKYKQTHCNDEILFEERDKREKGKKHQYDKTCLKMLARHLTQSMRRNVDAFKQTLLINPSCLIGPF